MHLTKEEVCELQQQLKSLQHDLRIKDELLSEHNNHLSISRALDAQYEHEIDSIQSNEKPETNRLVEKVRQLKESLSHLSQHLHEESSQQDSELTSLQGKLKVLSETEAQENEELQSSIKYCIYDENLALEKEMLVLNEDVCQTQLLVEQVRKDNFSLNEIVQNLPMEIGYLKEGIECKKQELEEGYSLINTVQPDLELARVELISLRRKSAKAQVPENSLFAEVNDKRLELHEVLLNLKNKCSQMRQEVASKQKQICCLRAHHEELTKLSKNDLIECQADYQAVIDTYTSRIQILESLCEEYQKIKLESQVLLAQGLPSNIMEFINHVISQKQEYKEKLKGAIGFEFSSQKLTFLNLKEITLELQEWKAMTEKLEAEVVQCSDRIQELRLPKSNKIEDYNSDLHHDDNKPCQDKIISIRKPDKDVTMQNVGGNNLKPEQKKVKFAENTVDTEASRKPLLRKGGKVIQCKNVHIPTVIKKK